MPDATDNPLDDPQADPFEIAAGGDEIAERTGVERHDIALTLGSGWAKAADLIGDDDGDDPGRRDHRVQRARRSPATSARCARSSCRPANARW